MSPRMLPRRPILPLASLLLAGCAQSQYVPGYAFYPEPAAVQVAHPTSPQNQQVPLTVLATVVGVRNADANAHVPSSVAVHLRFENNGPSRVLFDPRTLELSNGQLRVFPPPQTDPARVLMIAEAPHFPALLQPSPEDRPVQRALAGRLAELGEQGILDVPDPVEAAGLSDSDDLGQALRESGRAAGRGEVGNVQAELHGASRVSGGAPSRGGRMPAWEKLALIHIVRCRRPTLCRFRWSPYH